MDHPYIKHANIPKPSKKSPSLKCSGEPAGPQRFQCDNRECIQCHLSMGRVKRFQRTPYQCRGLLQLSILCARKNYYHNKLPKTRYHKRESTFRRAVFSRNAMPSTSQEYFKPENFIPIDLEKISPNIFLMRFSNSLERGHCYCVYFWRRAALFFSFCRQMMGPSEMVFSDDAVGGCLTVYIFFGCL